MQIQQQGYNPLAPMDAPTAMQQVNDYRQRAASLRGEAVQSMPVPERKDFNPYGSQEESQQDTQGKHVSNMEQWLSPVKMDAFDIQKEYTDEKHDNFLKNLENDPAVKEYGEQFHTYLEGLQEAVNQGQLSPDDAVNMGHDYIQNVVKPIIKKHHKSDSFKGLHRKEIVIPDIVKKIREGK
ncbi:hypothetical protein GFM72_21115 [Salmonella enterica]|nr:hypothetical protein [Salmonella enterica]